MEELEILLKSEAPVDIVLLDNFPIEDLKEAVKMIKTNKSHIKIEASGGITFENIEVIAKTGVDYISSGALTHSVKSADISLKIETIYNY